MEADAMCSLKTIILYPFLMVFFTCCGVLVPAPLLPAADLPPNLSTFLKEKLGMSAGEIGALEQGNPFVRLIDASDEREVALAGAVRLDAPSDFIAKKYQEMLSPAERPRLKALGIFSTPAVPEDVAGLSFPAGDLDDLEKCRVGDCKIKLYTEDMEKVKSGINWKGGNVQEEVDVALRKGMVGLVEEYRKRGDAAIPDYADKAQLMNAATGFDFLLKESPLLFEYLPDFFGSIRSYPGDQLESVDDFIFWSVEDPGSGLKETVFVTHAFVFSSKTAGGLPLVSIAHKRLHASHYYYAALRSATVIDYSQGAKPVTYMIFLDRHLFDGKLGAFKKRMLRNGLRDGLEDELNGIRKRIGEASRAESGG
jgi:hypothetical protein